MQKKYELTDNLGSDGYLSKPLHRIRALKDIYSRGQLIAKKGDFGGFVESEDNLSQDGGCWIADNAWVISNARIFDDAQIYGLALVSGEAQIFQQARAFQTASITGIAQIYGFAQAYESAYVFGNAKVWDFSEVHGFSRVYDNAKVYDSAKVYGYAEVYDFGEVCENASVYDKGVICRSDKACGQDRIHSGNPHYESLARIAGANLAMKQAYLDRVSVREAYEEKFKESISK